MARSHWGWSEQSCAQGRIVRHEVAGTMQMNFGHRIRASARTRNSQTKTLQSMTTMNITTDILDSTLAAVQQFDIFAARDAASNGTNPPGRFVVLPDASLLCNAAFLSFTPEWSCVIINASKAQRSIPGWGDIELAAQKFRTLTDYQIELVLMDSESPVTLFAEARYRAKPCIPKDVWRDRHCGDVFAAFKLFFLQLIYSI